MPFFQYHAICVFYSARPYSQKRKSRPSRANFYWKEADVIATGLTKKPERLAVVLKSFAEANRLPLPEHTGDIDKRFVSETLIDGHVAALMPWTRSTTCKH